MGSENVDPIFCFPFKPYSIQETFMKELYFTIDNKKSGIFESPTGTGKSLSICCSALQWLKDYNQKIIKDLENEIGKLKLEVSNDNGNEDWLQEEYDKIQKNQTICTLQLRLEKIKKQNEKFIEMKKRVAKQKLNVTAKTSEYNLHYSHKNKKDIYDKENIQDEGSNIEIGEDNDLILEECNENDGEESENEEIQEKEEEEVQTKIFISSRTHSQLSQFVGEIKRTVFKEDTRVVTLASRQHYCINPDVVKLKNVNLINERCLDLQKSKTKSTSVGEEGKVLKKTKTRSCTSCPYYNQTNITRLKERILTDIMDMEDLVKCGKEIKACPYYASRAALDDAEVALVSHAGIVSRGARAGTCLQLRDSALVMDEAHGLAAALEAAHCAPVAGTHLAAAGTFLQLYVNKYRARLSSRNLLSLNQMQYVVGRLLGMVSINKGEKNQDTPTILTLEDFVIKADIDHLHLSPLIELCRKTRLAPKLHGFSMRYTPQMLEEEMKKSAPVKKNSLEIFLKNISKKKGSTDSPEETKEPEPTPNVHVPAKTSPGTSMYAILDFLQMLCERSENGRVLVTRGEDGGQLKYLLLNPAEHFVEVVKQCRSVIVAGGTMEPIEEFVRLLTGAGAGEAVAREVGAREAGAAGARVRVVRCGHVVPAARVAALCVSKGPTNVTLNFSYERRATGELLTEIGRILRNVCNVVPGGVVCFLQSYSYEQTVYDHLRKSSVIEAINRKKTVFREPKSAANVDQVLSKYATAVRKKSGDQNGALLLSVVGGKLSEGLNFSDDLGRCVIVVGMPYPNKNSPELQEKMSYLNRTIGAGAGSAYYESLCMKAVNQCIGRAVRHANDYACVLLLDERYSRPHTINALPSFVQQSLLENCTFGKAFGTIGKFFTKYKDEQL